MTPSFASVEAATPKQRSYMLHGRRNVVSRSTLSLPAEKKSSTPRPLRPSSVRRSKVSLISPEIGLSMLKPKLLVMTSAPRASWAGKPGVVLPGSNPAAQRYISA